MEPQKTRNRWEYAPGVAAILAHGLALRNDFVLDDSELLIENPYVRTFRGLLHMLQASLFTASGMPRKSEYYRPATSLLNWLSWRLCGSNAAAQHALNVLMHAGAALLLYQVLKRWGARRGSALLCAVLFAVHPAGADIVAYLGGRQDMLGWLFILGALAWLPGKNPGWKAALVAFGATLLSSFSRESFLAVSLALPVAAWLQPQNRSGAARLGMVTAAGVGGAITVVALLRSLVGVGWSQPGGVPSIFMWIQTFAAFLIRMLRDVVAPTDLVVDLALPPASAPVSVLVLIALCAATAALLRRATRAGLGVLGALLVVLLAVVHTPIALRFGFISDRYAYGFVLGAAVALTPALQWGSDALANTSTISELMKRALHAVPWALAVALLPMTWARVADWSNEESLQRAMARDRPDDPHSKFALATLLLRKGSYAEALPLCESYREYYPRSSQPAQCLGMCYMAAHEYQKAIPFIREYLREHLDDETGRSALMRAYFATGQLQEAERELDGWGPELRDQPDVVAAREFIARARNDKTRGPGPLNP